MRGGIPIGKIAGIDIRLHYSWFIIFVLITWSLAYGVFPLTYPAWSRSQAISAGVITSLLFFGSVLAHELMHSIVARREGIPVHAITLFIFGGVSEMTAEPKAPRDEFFMALAGPMTSIAIGGICLGIFIAAIPNSVKSMSDLWQLLLPWGLLPASASTIGPVLGVALWLGRINLFLGVFNLVPGFPLDGGRVLRSIVWWLTNNLRQSTRVASSVGRSVGFLFILGGIIWIFGIPGIITANWFSGLWIVFIGWFLENAALSSYRQVAIEDALRGHTAKEIMTTDCTTVQPNLSLARLVNEYILTAGRRCFPVVESGRMLGLLTVHNVRSVPRERWDVTPAREVMTSLDNLKTVSPDEDLSRVLQIMAAGDVNQVPVVQDHNIVGMIGRDNLISFINVRNELGG